jgi:hypothetical protein
MIKLLPSDPRYEEMDKLANAFVSIANPHVQRVQMDVDPITYRQIKLTLEQCWKEYTESEDFQ